VDDPAGEERVGELRIKIRRPKEPMTKIRKRSAELHSAVSQIFNLLNARRYRDRNEIFCASNRKRSLQKLLSFQPLLWNERPQLSRRSAEYNSAIQQITNLRYERSAEHVGQNNPQMLSAGLHQIKAIQISDFGFPSHFGIRPLDL
jgi:hypothetical protein